ncbi:hypothetical protein Q7O_000079 [Pectobacterium carotovorum subsp. carotovorum PCCS1]|nr:hypothetical protein [Pectobacterium carotovorum subsp. carotovorum PCCS1]
MLSSFSLAFLESKAIVEVKIIKGITIETICQLTFLKYLLKMNQ